MFAYLEVTTMLTLLFFLITPRGKRLYLAGALGLTLLIAGAMILLIYALWGKQDAIAYHFSTWGSAIMLIYWGHVHWPLLSESPAARMTIRVQRWFTAP